MGERWSEEETALLRRCWDDRGGVTVEETDRAVATAIGRTAQAVKTRRKILGLVLARGEHPVDGRWTPQDLDAVRRWWRKKPAFESPGRFDERVGRELGRTAQAVKTRRKILGLTWPHGGARR